MHWIAGSKLSRQETSLYCRFALVHLRLQVAPPALGTLHVGFHTDLAIDNPEA